MQRREGAKDLFLHEPCGYNFILNGWHAFVDFTGTFHHTLNQFFMFYHVKDLQFNARVSRPDPAFATLLSQQKD